MATSKGRRISSIKEAKEIPSGSNFIMELPNGGNSRRVTQKTLTKTVYENLKYGTDADVDAIIAGTYEDPPEDDWGEDDTPSDGDESGGDSPGGDTPINPEDIATDQEVQDYIDGLNLFGD